MAEWSRYWTLNQESVCSSVAKRLTFGAFMNLAPRIMSKIYHIYPPVPPVVNENLAIHILYVHHPWHFVACIRVLCSAEELRCRCVHVCRG